MSEHRQNQNPEPRGRHVRPNPAQQSSAPPPHKPQSQPRGAGQPAAVPQQPSQQPTASQATRQPQQAPAAGQPRTSQASPNSQSRPSGYVAAQPAGAQGKKGGKGGRTDGTKKRSPWRIIFWIALVALVLSLAALGALMFSYWQGQSAYDAVAEEVFAPPADIEGTALSDITVDWEKLKAINPDTIAWVYMPDTQINYPIVHTADDEKYLTTDFNGKQTWGATYGSIFLSAANNVNFTDANNIIYGHNLNNGSMFADIMKLDNVDQFNGHRTLYILTPEGNYQLRTFSLVHCAADDPLAQTAFADEAERTTYLQDKLDRSVVPATDVVAMNEINHAFAFATCDNLPTDGRYVLFAYIADSTVPSMLPAGADEVAPDGLVDPSIAQAVEGSTQELAV